MDQYLRPELQPALIDDDVLRLNAALQRAQAPSLLHDPLEVIRHDRHRTARPLPGAIERSIEGPCGKIALRMFMPQKVERVCLHFHDGAWATGAAHMQDLLLVQLAKRCNAVVISADYRLAPEHPYPAGPDDAEAVALWLCNEAAQEFGVSSLVIWGESAGAHLAVLSLLRLRDKHGVAAFSAAVLNYGSYDLALTPSARNFGDRQLLINTPTIERFIDFFVPRDVDRRDPDVSPLYARLEGLPPALFSVGTHDPFLDDSTFMASRWLCAGNHAQLALYPGCPHGFTFFPVRAAMRAFERQVSFVQNMSLTDHAGPTSASG